MTTTKERPLNCKSWEVRAILAGRRRMMRRLVTDRHFKRLGLERDGECVRTFDGPQWDGTFESGAVPWCPYGSPGSHLWVKETYTPDHREFYPHLPVAYKADAALDYDRNEKGEVYSPEQKSWYPYRWRSSRYMPRLASRITLQVEAVRVERLQEITGQDAKAEGCEPDWESFEEATCDKDGWDEPEEFDEECEVEGDWVNYGRRLVETHEHEEWEADRTNYALRLAFRNLWESINGDGSWDANCWVWVVSFSVVKP